MSCDVFFKGIPDKCGSKKRFRQASDRLQSVLVDGGDICCCVKYEGGKVSAHFQVFSRHGVDQFQARGDNLNKISSFIDNHLIPMMTNWGKSYKEFFDMASEICCDLYVGEERHYCRNCQKENCMIYQQLRNQNQSSTAA